MNGFLFFYNSRTQTGPILYKTERKYGLIIEGEYSKELFDSLVYYGDYFIAAQKKRGKLQFGLLDGKCRMIVPFEYDSMPGTMQEFEQVLVGVSPNVLFYFIQLQELRDGTTYSGSANPYVRRYIRDIFVYKNRKCGLISETGHVIIPIEYDAIAYNGMDFSLPRKTDYLILKKDGSYGIMRHYYNESYKRITEIIPPVFPYVPANYVDDYYATPGFRLFALYDEQYRFMGFANENGVLYFKEEK